MSGQGVWGGGVPPVPPTSPPALPLHPATTSLHPFCEHVLQHSCCSTFLWQRLFFLTSTQKLPSAQDSSFAFHRAGRRDTRGGRGGGGRLEGEGRRKTHTYAHTRRGRTISNGSEPCNWSGDRKSFLSNHRWCSQRRKMIVVRWSDWIHVTREEIQEGEKNRDRQSERHNKKSHN